MVLTSHDKLGYDTEEKSGLWYEELAAPYFLFKDAGIDVVLASPKGGKSPVDWRSELPQFQTDATRRFDADPAALEQLASTVPLNTVSHEGFDAVFYPGGHGPLFDLAEDADSVKLIETTVAAGKPLALVCHGPGALRHAKGPDGRPIVNGKRVTGFKNSEEASVDMTQHVPFSVEDELVRLGGLYSSAEDWHPHVVEDGLLITGQSPASADPAARALLNKLRP
ncbi:ThiJ/PfpI domain-containing protein [Caballeronia fortuita]|uniref:ThiJ/PfpI domain-containing protein n=2 Tax=Caballeronia fortuita TaxID=1777138 RepID=A0A158CVB1_9BURK|nr:ThiJ/PfpI domain-containing protein [Caballeronia fortuita]